MRDERGRTRDGRSSRDRLLDLIHRQPGVNKTSLCEATGLAWGTVDYHLRLLARGGLVSIQPQGRTTRFFPAVLGARQQGWLAMLADGQALRLAALLRERPGQGNRALSDGLDLSPKVVRRHLVRMVRDGLLERQGAHRPRYRLRADAEAILEEIMPQAGAPPQLVPVPMARGR